MKTRPNRKLPNGDTLTFQRQLNRERVVVIHRSPTGAQVLIMNNSTFYNLGEQLFHVDANRERRCE